jgi:ornithine--oxo-acid transaminase
MNSGAEAGETAVKLARRWGYVKKGLPDNKAEVVCMEGNFWGRTITASGACDDPSRYN